MTDAAVTVSSPSADRTGTAQVVYLVPHSHWDREWYQPFQRFRMRLVDLVDRVLALAEADRGFRFTFDGQLAAVDDYLEIRPEAEDRVRRLVARGQLAIGPWRVLADEFLVSGETLIRNLERGWRRAERLGGGLRAGYLPDEFGHAAQMPQILRRGGLDRAVVWRGVPGTVDRHAFTWVSPDGSAVLTEYLPDGYGNAAFLLTPGGRPGARMARLAAELAPFFAGRPLLAMCGGDHTAPLPDLVQAVADLNRAEPTFQVRLATLAEYLDATRDQVAADARAGRLPRWVGELRSSARANILVGVTSARVGVKARCTGAERLLERYAEPLAALWAPGRMAPFLDLAWDRVIDAAGHDSVTGCGVDAVADDVAGRLQQAAQLAEGVRDRVGELIAAASPRETVVVVNPSARARTGRVEIELDPPPDGGPLCLVGPDGRRHATQELSRSGGPLHQERLDGPGLARVARRIHGGELFGRWILGWAIDPAERRVTVELGRRPETLSVDPGGLAAELERAARDSPGDWRLELRDEPRCRVAAMAAAPPLGWAAHHPAPGAAPLDHPVHAIPHGLGNGLVSVAAEPEGTLRLEGAGQVATGLGRLVDGGDAGDLYNYAPPERDTRVGEPTEVAVAIERTGPVLGELVVTRTYRWPLGLTADRRARSDAAGPVVVTTTATLVAGEPFVRLRLAFTNPASDHRVRLHLPLPRTAAASAAEGQLAVVERGVGPVEGGHGEVPLATHPARGFVDAGGLAVLLDRVSEYELLDGQEIALTVVRAVGQISRNDNRYREEPAGPELPTPGAQCLGPVGVACALLPHAGSWAEADVVGAAEVWHHPLLAAAGSGAPGSVREAAGLWIEGRGVQLSSLRERDGWLELRLVLLHPAPTSVTIGGGWAEARGCDLLGREPSPLAVRDGSVRLDLAPFEIATLQLRR